MKGWFQASWRLMDDFRSQTFFINTPFFGNTWIHKVFHFLHSNKDSSTKIKAFPLDLSTPWRILGHRCFLMVACCCDRRCSSRIVKFEHLVIYPSQIVILYLKTPGWISYQSNHVLFISKGTSEKNTKYSRLHQKLIFEIFCVNKHSLRKVTT